MDKKCRLGAVALALTAAMTCASAADGGRRGIEWQRVSTDAEVDGAFAAARKSGKPVFLYWGAVWCPPCNQVKATLFSRADFIERSHAFVSVYVDGDKPGAQKVASRFKVSGYPTMVLFKPDGTEITRLPGEVDAQRYLLTMTTAMNAQAPVKELVSRALAHQPLTPEQWRLLAFYSWEQQQVLTAAELPKQLEELAAAAPAELPQIRDRLAFKALLAQVSAAESDDKPTATAGPVADAGRKLVDRILGDPQASRELADLLIGYAEPTVQYLAAPGDARRALASRWEAALEPSLDGLSRGDRVDALDAQVALWKFIDGRESLAPARREQVARDIGRLVTATTDRYERQAVVPSAAHVLTAAGLIDESDALLKAELGRAVSPYYHMLGLASNAKKRNDTRNALYWYEQAWRKSEGPATRIQWGTGFVGQLVALAPSEIAKVQSSAGAVIAQLDAKDETFYERNQRSLQRMARKLLDWQGSDPARQRAVNHLKTQLARTCAKVPAREPGRANCDAVFSGNAPA